MNKTALKIFLCVTLISAAVATSLLIFNFIGVAFLASDTQTQLTGTPHKNLRKIDDALIKTADGWTLADEELIPRGCWAMLIDESGTVVWSQNKPDDIPDHYSLNDIARMTRWFLQDYPVYVRTRDDGLLVYAIPKNSVGKYDIAYSMEWFETLPRRLLLVLFLNLLLAGILALLIGQFLYRRIAELTDGISALQREHSVHLREKGIFKELAENINTTSELISRKNTALTTRDSARSNWISGISHDIRTPLAIVMGNAEALEQDDSLTDEQRRKAGIITRQSIRIKKLIADLNLISSLEYDMQPSQKKSVSLCPLIRKSVAELVNSGLSEHCEIQLHLQNERASVFADESLLERALINLISNSMTHNADGCTICIQSYTSGHTAHIILSDNGTGVPPEVLENMDSIPKSTHGLGLPMAYKIIAVHGGKLTARNHGGFTAEITLPLET